MTAEPTWATSRLVWRAPSLRLLGAVTDLTAGSMGAGDTDVTFTVYAP